MSNRGLAALFVVSLSLPAYAGKLTLESRAAANEHDDLVHSLLGPTDALVVTYGPQGVVADTPSTALLDRRLEAIQELEARAAHALRQRTSRDARIARLLRELATLTHTQRACVRRDCRQSVALRDLEQRQASKVFLLRRALRHYVQRSSTQASIRAEEATLRAGAAVGLFVVIASFCFAAAARRGP